MFFTVLKNVLDTFGAYVFVPVILYVIARILKCTRKKAFTSALFAGIGLEGFSLIINSYMPIITPLVDSMVKGTGINLPVVDMGWQTTAIVAYSTKVGMIYLGLCIVLQVVLFLIKWTDVFQAADLWNNYSYMTWGSIIYVLTGSMALSIACMVMMTLYTLLCAEMMQKRWATYYHYPRCTVASLHTVGAAPFAIVCDILWDKLHLNRIKADPKSIQNKLGFLGEPTTLGLLLGLFLGILGNLTKIGTLAGWGSIAKVGIATAAVMAIFPKVSGIFASAFTIITDASKKATKGDKSRVWYIAINDAAGYGETATLISGILLIPTMLLIAFICPGNKVLPMVDLIGLPYIIQEMVCISDGNIVKTILSSVIWFTVGLLFATNTAPAFTEVAKQVGVSISGSSGLYITSFVILVNPLAGLIFLAFLSRNVLLIGLVVVIYFASYFIFKKNKERLQNFLEDRVVKNRQLIEEKTQATA